MKFRYKIFIVLALLSVFAAIFVLPYLLSLTGDLLDDAQAELGLEGAAFNMLIVVQSSIMYTIAALIGVFIYRRAGFRMPLLEKFVDKEDVEFSWGPWLRVAIGTGVLVAVLVTAGDYLFKVLGSSLTLLGSDLPTWWKGLLGAYSAAVGEEVLFRLLIMTVLTLLFKKLFRLQQPAAVWGAIAVAAVLFGLMHLPITAAVVTLTPLMIVRALLLNGIGAVAFGWLYWKRGLEAAIVAHFVTDVIVHGLLQLL